MRRAPPPAFTLLELSVALAIAGLVSAAALTATVSLQKSFVSTRKATELADDVRFTLEHVLSPVRIAGGGAVRPWQAVSNSCKDDPRFPLPACGTQQGRLHVVKLEARGQCRILSSTPTQVLVAPVGGVCCIAALNGFAPTAAGAVPNPVVLFPNELVATSLGGPAWRARTCEPLAAPACGCTIVDSKIGFDAQPPVGTLTDANLVDGVIARGAVKSFFVRPTTNHLMALFDVAKVGVAAATELTPRVIGFEARLGYDSAPVDGVVDLPLVPTPVSDPLKLGDLRLLRVGIAAGARVADDRVVGGSLFGVPVAPPGKRVVVAEGNAVLRALGVFQ